MIDSNIIVAFIIILRSLIPFTILRFPLLGGFLAMIADGIDIMFYEAFGYGFLTGVPYHYIDKVFDMWYLFFEFIIILRWTDITAKNTGKVLFFWRLAGFFVFMIFGFRQAFFFAPNIFEYFFLAMLIIWKLKPKFKLKKKSLIIILLITGIPTIIKEYIYHFAYTDKVWIFFKDHLFYWLYD